MNPQPQLPQAFLDRMKGQIGEAYVPFIDSLQQTVPTSVRINPLKPFKVPESWKSMQHHPDGYYLTERPAFYADPYFHAGAYYVQEASSMVIHAMVDWSSPSLILDLCAAPGGKSTLIAAAMSEDSLLIANEPIRNRAQILAENLTKWGSAQTIVCQNDPAHFGKLGPQFDVVLVDAPCSGEGMFRKDHNACTEWSEEHVHLCAGRQKRILNEAFKALKPGGKLIYCTCTFAPEENIETVEWLANTFEMESLSYPTLSNYGFQEIQINQSSIRGYQAFPHLFRGEGFFVAGLKKRGLINDGHEKKRLKKERQTKISKEIHQFAHQYLKQKEQDLVVRGEFLSISPKRLNELTTKGLRFIKSGLSLGKIHRKGVNPSHELALSTNILNVPQKIELDYEHAIRYLKRETIQAQSPGSNGWAIASYNGVNLGWLKGNKGNLKNYYPIQWRIRKDVHTASNPIYGNS